MTRNLQTPPGHATQDGALPAPDVYLAIAGEPAPLGDRGAVAQPDDAKKAGGIPHVLYNDRGGVTARDSRQVLKPSYGGARCWIAVKTRAWSRVQAKFGVREADTSFGEDWKPIKRNTKGNRSENVYGVIGHTEGRI